MELLLNIAWLALSVLLAFLWKKELRDIAVRSQRPDVRVQLVALALLVIILLPVISMTDDMHAMSAAEIEHVTRRVDMLPVADQPANITDLIHAELFLALHLTGLHPLMRLEPAIQTSKPLTGSVRQTANRPPPFDV